MSTTRKHVKKGGDRARRITVRAVRRTEPNLGRLSRAALALAVAQAEADAEAQARTGGQQATSAEGQTG